MPDVFAGLDLRLPVVMGIINVTPDSFSDGGETFAHDAAVERGWQMVADGAKILDVGGESTRPGAAAVSVAEEIDRVVPVIDGLRGSGVVISIDTRHARVMAAAVAAGAGVVNDVSALTGDDKSLEVACELGVPVILMHMQGTPENMQRAPSYENAPDEVHAYLADRVNACVTAGFRADQIAVDPGIGFGKTQDHNLEILNRIEIFHDLAGPIVLGVSRKSFIGRLAGADDPHNRVPGSIAAAVLARQKGVQIFRVHDVPETVQALAVADAIVQAGR